MRKKLKPCPFCGKKVKMSFDFDMQNYKIECENGICGIFDFHIDADGCDNESILEEETILAWNKRK